MPRKCAKKYYFGCQPEDFSYSFRRWLSTGTIYFMQFLAMSHNSRRVAMDGCNARGFFFPPVFFGCKTVEASPSFRRCCICLRHWNPWCLEWTTEMAPCQIKRQPRLGHIATPHILCVLCVWRHHEVPITHVGKRPGQKQGEAKVVDVTSPSHVTPAFVLSPLYQKPWPDSTSNLNLPSGFNNFPVVKQRCARSGLITLQASMLDRCVDESAWVSIVNFHNGNKKKTYPWISQL